MQFPEQIFKAYDIRGKVGEELTPELAEQVGASFGAWLEADGAIAVGYDMRPDSQALAEGLIKGLTSVGRDVVSIGQVASDMIYFTVGNFGYAGGAMVTASHNPGADNGIKLCREGARPIGIESGLLEIRDSARDHSYQASEKVGTVSTRDVKADWVNFALAMVAPDSWPAYNVVVDAGNGMAGAVVPYLEGKVPLHIDPLYFELDGTFPNHIANPLVPENLRDLQARIAETKADFGIAFDGDGDRAVVVDENGDALSGTVTTAILARYFLERNPGATILFNAVCGRVVPEVVAEHGGTSRRTKVGHSYIKADMRKYDAVMAGEHSGHYYFKDNFYADSGLVAALMIIQVLSEHGGTLSELADEYRKRYTVIPETNFTVDDKEARLEALDLHYSGHETNDLDGLTVEFEDGWVNIRASNTEPLLRLNAEAATKERLTEIVDEAKTIITAP